ncbi:hypothetical protein ILUMI_18489, partial [Ignelater luminosus]
ISDDGVIDVEAAIAMLPEDVRPKVEPTVRKCGTQISWLAWKSTQKYYVQTVTDSTNHQIWNYPFPAITICGVNQISKSKLYDMINKIKRPEEWSTELSQQDFRYLVQLLPGSSDIAPQQNLTRFQDLLDRNNIAAEDLFQKVAPNCKEILQKCKWKGEEKSPLAKRLPKKPRRVAGCGFKAGLEVLIDNKLEDYYAASAFSYGYRILIHHPYDFADWSVRTMMLGLKRMMFLGVVPKLTECSSNVASLDAKDRNCSLFSEREMNSFHYYTHHNCLTECRSKIVMRLCGCIPFYHYNKNGN